MQDEAAEHHAANAWKYARAGDLVGLQHVPAAGLNAVYGDMTLLALAAENGHLECVQYLLGRRTGLAQIVDVDARVGRRQSTALHLAAHRGDLAVVNALLASYADTRIRNRDDKTAADAARQGGHAWLADLLERARIAQNGQLLEANNELPVTMDCALVTNAALLQMYPASARPLRP